MTVLSTGDFRRVDIGRNALMADAWVKMGKLYRNLIAGLSGAGYGWPPAQAGTANTVHENDVPDLAKLAGCPGSGPEITRRSATQRTS